MGPTWGGPAGAAGAGSGALVPDADSVEPGESSLLACSGDSPSLLLSSSKAKVSADLGKLTWVPARGEGVTVRALPCWKGDERGGGWDGVSLVGCLRVCARLLQTWLRAKDEGRGAQRAQTPPPIPSRAQGQLLGVPPRPRLAGEEVASAVAGATMSWPVSWTILLGRGREEASEEPGLLGAGGFSQAGGAGAGSALPSYPTVGLRWGEERYSHRPHQLSIPTPSPHHVWDPVLSRRTEVEIHLEGDPSVHGTRANTCGPGFQILSLSTSFTCTTCFKPLPLPPDCPRHCFSPLQSSWRAIS